MNNLFLKSKDYLIILTLITIFANITNIANSLDAINTFNETIYFNSFIFSIAFFLFTFYSDRFKDSFDLKEVVVFGFGSAIFVVFTSLLSMFYFFKLDEEFVLIPLSIIVAYAVGVSTKMFFMFFFAIKKENLTNLNYITKYLLAIFLTFYVSYVGSEIYLSLFLPENLINIIKTFDIQHLATLLK